EDGMRYWSVTGIQTCALPILLCATLRIRRLPGTTVRLDATLIEDLGSVPGLLQDAAARSDIAYTWHDLSFNQGRFGRGVLVQGKIGRASCRGRTQRTVSAGGE